MPRTRRALWLEWKPLTSWKKWIAGSGWGKTAEERGFKVQSPIQASGEALDSKKTRHVRKQKIIYSKVSVTGDHVVIHFNCKSVPF